MVKEKKTMSHLSCSAHLKIVASKNQGPKIGDQAPEDTELIILSDRTTPLAFAASKHEGCVVTLKDGPELIQCAKNDILKLKFKLALKSKGKVLVVISPASLLAGPGPGPIPASILPLESFQVEGKHVHECTRELHAPDGVVVTLQAVGDKNTLLLEHSKVEVICGKSHCESLCDCLCFEGVKQEVIVVNEKCKEWGKEL